MFLHSCELGEFLFLWLWNIHWALSLNSRQWAGSPRLVALPAPVASEARASHPLIKTASLQPVQTELRVTGGGSLYLWTLSVTNARPPHQEAVS